MKQLLKLSAFALFIIASAFVVVNFNTSSVNAQENPEQSENQEQSEEAKSPYSYTAQPGDSYTKIARKAVQTYGINNNVQLSQAQIIAAETFLTVEAGSPTLNEGQSIVLSEESVKSAVEKAKDLDEAAQARWEKYVSGVNFDTNNVGESR